jgi:hypothetical protein
VRVHGAGIRYFQNRARDEPISDVLV